METLSLTRKRIIDSLKEGKRFDGRRNDQFREISIETGVSNKAEGSARVKIGNTDVVVGIKMDVTTPFADSANKGTLMVSAELLPLSSSRYEYGPPKFEAIECGRLVDRAIRESKVIDFEKLCIKEGEKVWSVFIDLYPINDDGNLLDAFTIGALVALKNARMHVYDEEKGKVQYGEWTSKKIPLTDTIPLLLSMHKVGESFFVDPNKEEEDTSETNLMIAMSGATGAPIIHAMQKNGEDGLTSADFEEVLTLAEKVWKEMYPKLLKDLEHKSK